MVVEMNSQGKVEKYSIIATYYEQYKIKISALKESIWLQLFFGYMYVVVIPWTQVLCLICTFLKATGPRASVYISGKARVPIV